MRLSEAMMLGRVTCKMVACDWNSCALGAAENALGIAEHSRDFSRRIAAYNEWPWLQNECVCGCANNLCHITQAFDRMVAPGKMTFEQLVDWVRSVEPDEPEETPAPVVEVQHANA